MIKRLFLAMVLTLALSFSAFAADNGFYLGLKFIDSIQSTGDISKGGGTKFFDVDNYSQNTIGGGLPPAQYVGQEPETISISAELRPEVTGGDGSVDLLRQMAATGEPYTLILGNGRVLGSYVILSIKDSQTQLMHDGKARAISFGMELKKVGDSAVGLSGQALGMAAGAVRALIGI